MRYWIFDERTKRAMGPHLAQLLPKHPGFGPESKVAPEGTKDWKRAQDIDELKPLFAPPPAPKPKG